MPTVTVSGTDYRQFRLDVNETDSESLITLEEVYFFCSDSPLDGSYTDLLDLQNNSGATLVWGNSGTSIDLDYSNAPGSGNGDAEFLIPDEDFTDAGCTDDSYVILWSKFSDSDSGFEEWSVLKQNGLGVRKDGEGSYTRTTTWEIDKSANPDTLRLFIGEADSSAYTVDVDKNVQLSNIALSGTVWLYNPSEGNNQNTIQIKSIADTIRVEDGSGSFVAAQPVTLDCGGANSIAPGDSLGCTWTADGSFLSNVDPDSDSTFVTNDVFVGYGFGSNNRNAVVIDTSAATFSVDFGDPADPNMDVSNVGVDSVDVVDYPEWLASEVLDSDLKMDSTYTYKREFVCGEDSTYNNVAKLLDPNTQEEIDSDAAEVVVECYGLTVEKTGSGSYEVEYDWTITKSATNVSDTLTLTQGQPFMVTYQIAVAKDDGTASNWAASGTIKVTNNHPTDAATDIDVSDTLANAVLDCGDGDGDTVIDSIPAGGGMASCTWTDSSMSDASDFDNIATAELFNASYVDTTTVTFGTPTVKDDCADVADEDLGFSASGVCADSTFDETDGLTKLLDTGTCGGGFSFQNIAKVTEVDTNEMDADTVTVVWDIPCPGGCTLTQGYWKTHNQCFRDAHNGNGPPLDSTWADVGGCDAPFSSDTAVWAGGASWYDVFWTPPQGNAYYNLAHQWMAAVLNVENESVTTIPELDSKDCDLVRDLADDESASCTDIQSVIAAGGSLLSLGPDAAEGLKGKDKKAYVTLASILASYNEGDGLVCDEDGVDYVNLAEIIASKESATTSSSSESTSSRGDGESQADATSAIPTEYALAASYPNPFQRSTTLGFDLPEATHVTLRVYDLLGREVARVVDRTIDEGSHEIEWDASGLASGTYIVHLRAGTFIKTQQITLMK